jgi:nitrate reductase (cytochrome), electron transfer subunit
MSRDNGNIQMSGNGLLIFGAVVLGVSLIGFMRATSEEHYDFESSVSQVEISKTSFEGVLIARSYLEMRDGPRGKGSRFDRDLVNWFEDLPSRTDPVEKNGNTEADLALRTSRRAYDGAPPVIPHPVRQGTAAECRACHESGVKIGNEQAPPYPHKKYESCTQCHTMDEPNLPWGDGDSSELEKDPRAVVNSFVGLEAPKEGPRWTESSPPEIPHNTFMHERCDTCHGVAGKNSMRSTHPDRQNCEQCHVSKPPLELNP